MSVVVTISTYGVILAMIATAILTNLLWREVDLERLLQLGEKRSPAAPGWLAYGKYTPKGKRYFKYRLIVIGVGAIFLMALYALRKFSLS